MKQLFILSALLGLGLAMPPPSRSETSPEVFILSQTNTNTGTGPYQFSYSTSDGSFREEKAEYLDPKDPESPLVVKGSYGYTGPDGLVYTTHYTAGVNGFQVSKPT